MPFIKNTSYRNIPFSSETPKGDFYTYSDVSDLAIKIALIKGSSLKCRTIGVLQSINGKYFLTNLDTPSVDLEQYPIRVSMVYLKTPVQSATLPYPVQIFGTLLWKNRPVIFANLIQVLSAPNAIRIRNAMNEVAKNHLAGDCYEDSVP